MSDVQPVPVVTRRDVRALVERLGRGTFPSAAIYRLYREMMAEEGREPVAQRTLGRALSRARQRRVSASVGGRSTRCWRTYPPEWLGGDETPE